MLLASCARSTRPRECSPNRPGEHSRRRIHTLSASSGYPPGESSTIHFAQRPYTFFVLVRALQVPKLLRSQPTIAFQLLHLNSIASYRAHKPVQILALLYANQCGASSLAQPSESLIDPSKQARHAAVGAASSWLRESVYVGGRQAASQPARQTDSQTSRRRASVNVFGFAAAVSLH